MWRLMKKYVVSHPICIYKKHINLMFQICAFKVTNWMVTIADSCPGWDNTFLILRNVYGNNYLTVFSNLMNMKSHLLYLFIRS